MLRVEQLKLLNLPPLTFAVADGECIAVEGPSGSGKTTLLRAIADLDPAEGHVFLDGAERNEMPAHVWRRSVRYVSSEPGWWTDTPRQALATDGNETRIVKLLQAVGLETTLLDRDVSRLSTGERQRLAVVRALLDEPKVLLFDEPTAALDANNAALIEELIKYLKLSQHAILLVSHDPAQIDRLADKRLQLADTTSTTQFAEVT